MSKPGAAPARRKRVDYYKWSAGVLVPIAVAVIGALKFGGSGTATTPGNLSIVTNISIIEKQYQQITGQPLADPAARQLLESAVNLAKAGQFDASRRLFEKLAETVPVPAVYSNLGALRAEAGEVEQARQAYLQALERSPDYRPARDNLAALSRPAEAKPVAGRREAEPNQDILRANAMPLALTVSGAISDTSDADYFQIATPGPPRDLLEISLANGSTTLCPHVQVFDGGKNHVHTEYRSTAGADLQYAFSAAPDSRYFIRVDGSGTTGGSLGAYSLTVRPLKKYDRFEPNDEIAAATRISPGQSVEAGLMDENDTDIYAIRPPGGSISVSVKNASTTLAPHVVLYDENKNHVQTDYRGTPGADLEWTHAVTAGRQYFLAISGRGATGSSRGAYRLTAR